MSYNAWAVTRCALITADLLIALLLSYSASSQILKPADKKKFNYGGLAAGRPVTPPRGSAATAKAKGKM